MFLYLFLVIAIQILLPQNHPAMHTAPLFALAEHTFGGGGRLVAVLSCVIILANLVGAVWAASRLVFSSAREGLLPRFIATTGGDKVPRTALTVTCALFITVLVANHFRFIGVDDMLRLAGQNFFVLYGMSVLAYIKIATSIAAKTFGVLCAIIVLATMGSFGLELLYTAALLVAGYVAGKYFAR